MFIIVANSVFAGLGLYGYRTSPPMFVAALILTILSFKFYFKDRIVGTLPNLIKIPMIIIGVSYGVFGIAYFVPTYILCGYAFLIQLPIFYCAVKRDYLKEMMITFTKAYVIIATLVLIACMLFAPLTDGQYYGIYNNPNLFGQFLSPIAISAIYWYEISEVKRTRIIMLVIFGLSLAFTLFSKSRTTLLAFACIAVVYFIYIIITKKKFVKRFAAFAIAILVMVPATFGTLYSITPVVCSLTGIEVNMQERSLEDELLGAYSRYTKGLKDDGNSFTSGRTEIWKDFLRDTGLKGHKVDALIVEYSGGSYSVNSHNTFIQVAYQSGIISGIAFLLMFGAICIYIVRKALKKTVSQEDLFAAGCLANALPYLMLANVIGPYATFATVPFWLMMIPYYSVKYKEER